MKKLLIIFISFILISLSSCANKTKSSPFDFESNAVECLVNIDGVDDDALWQGDNVVSVSFGTCDVKIVREKESIYLFFKVYDVTPYRYVSTGNATEVTKSDSVEFYFDSKLTRTEHPANNDYQINLARDGRTRICSGAGWITWMALYMFEVKEGSILTGDEEYYYVEAMIPVKQMNISDKESIGIAFGQVDRHVDENIDLEEYYTWTGYTYNNKFLDPQIPSTYLVLIPSESRLYTYQEYLNMRGNN